MTKIIGLTGGIGSGKTTIARLFEAEGIPVYISDDEAKKIMLRPITVEKVRQEFGDLVIDNGQIDRKALSEIVFNNPEQLKKLNSIVHPLVKKHFDEWVKQNSHHPFVVKEAAILFESGSYKYCDKVITVTASEETRIERVVKRDHVKPEEVLQRIKNQIPEKERLERSNFIIYNEYKTLAKEQFLQILKILKNIH
ncbi:MULTISPECIES: dephospho-CoA kinase [Flavobacterium]|uniref:Dephospho-CoA kinase n=1 Tax=Flavobacterium hankyongi TaxID=1176532 RepID=A0ABP8ZY39_9FLAO|nr:dephospho-CoA kinase [Flavobacterium sp. N1846]